MSGFRTADRPGLSPAAGLSPIGTSAALPVEDALTRLGVAADAGLSTAEAHARLIRDGPNVVATHHARPLLVLWHQIRSPLLLLLLVAAAVSFGVGQRNDAVVIGVIVTLSVGLGFVNEYRAESAAAALHSQIRRQARAIRNGVATTVDVADLVPGDVVYLRLGDVVPADLRLIRTDGLLCDESMITGESMPTAKQVDRVQQWVGSPPTCALMGTVVAGGTATGVVVGTGPRTTFGRIAAGLSTHQLDTEFQVGLRKFSMMLVWVAAALTTGIVVVNLVLQRPALEAVLFSLAIAVGITPQLLPAIVSTSLAAGAHQLGRRHVLVKRLVCIEDLGDADLLLTDKTGTLTEGRISFMRAVPSPGTELTTLITSGLLCTDPVGEQTSNLLDQALWRSPATADARGGTERFTRLAQLPFDHTRRMMSVLVGGPDQRVELITKGAPESVVARCRDVRPEVADRIDHEFAAGNRVVAVAARAVAEKGAAPQSRIAPEDERDLELLGLLVFLDPVKRDAAAAVGKLRDLQVRIKIVTGDNPTVAATVCAGLGLPAGQVLDGSDLDRLDDRQLADQIERTMVFARVTPEQKARIVTVAKASGRGVAYLGDGVNDALALHAADVGISVDTAADVAKDAADVILLEKSLNVLADGIIEGRRIFTNTMKYVLMGTSSNFGNMFSAAGASMFLPFLPMLPSQILLNNLMYDVGQLTIPTDHVDPDQQRRPSHWDIGFIRRFMLVFGPLSSLFDFATFAVMLWVFHSGPEQFRTGWFVESLATQVLIIFVIRTRRVPFFRSRPSLPLTLSSIGVVLIGIVLPRTPLADPLGFTPLPTGFFVALVAMIATYMVLVDVVKRIFYAHQPRALPPGPRSHEHPAHRRASRFSTATRHAVPRRTRRHRTS